MSKRKTAVAEARIDVERIADSCGYGVPLMRFERKRTQYDAWLEKKVRDDALDDYVADEMSHSAMHLINRDESRHIAIDFHMTEKYSSDEYWAVQRRPTVRELARGLRSLAKMSGQHAGRRLVVRDIEDPLG